MTDDLYFTISVRTEDPKTTLLKWGSKGNDKDVVIFQYEVTFEKLLMDFFMRIDYSSHINIVIDTGNKIRSIFFPGRPVWSYISKSIFSGICVEI